MLKAYTHIPTHTHTNSHFKNEIIIIIIFIYIVPFSGQLKGALRRLKPVKSRDIHDNYNI